ncbi:MAG: hypothetical protein KA354_24055 [Phycisphaerae bacterium]|nr:hypothetical protein [Phycisphaerae bacterium]
MSRFMVQTVRFRFLVAALLVIGTAVSGAWAQKGGGGRTGGGTIFFEDCGACTYTWSMNSDGSNINPLGFFACFQYPSRTLHNTHRWFLAVGTIPDSYYPDGTTQRAEVFAYRDDCTKVQLTNDATLDPAGSWWYGMQWLPGDQKISFKARRWSGTTITEGGIYTADLLYDADGNIIGLAAQPTLALAFSLNASGWPDFGVHSWDPAGNRVVYNGNAVTGLWVADLAANTRTLILAGNAAYPDWSPDGTKILFNRGGICTIKPNGTGLKEVIKPTYLETVYWSGFGHAYFSPTGSHIVCVGCTSHNGGNNDVFRATSSGGSLTNLTKTDSVNEIPIGWR